MQTNHANNPTHHRIVVGAAERGGRRAFMDLNIRPRKNLMQRAVWNIALPLLAVATIATVSLFPNPRELAGAVQNIGSMNVLAAHLKEGTYAQSFIKANADGVPGLSAEIVAQSDCFIGLESATADRIRECAPAVTAIIAQIVEHQNNPVVADALRAEHGKFLPQIQIAAAEVCRSLWATGKEITAHLDEPSCLMAQVALAGPSTLQ